MKNGKEISAHGKEKIQSYPLFGKSFFIPTISFYMEYRTSTSKSTAALLLGKQMVRC